MIISTLEDDNICTLYEEEQRTCPDFKEIIREKEFTDEEWKHWLDRCNYNGKVCQYRFLKDNLCGLKIL